MVRTYAAETKAVAVPLLVVSAVTVAICAMRSFSSIVERELSECWTNILVKTVRIVDADFVKPYKPDKVEVENILLQSQTEL